MRNVPTRTSLHRSCRRLALVYCPIQCRLLHPLRLCVFACRVAACTRLNPNGGGLLLLPSTILKAFAARAVGGHASHHTARMGLHVRGRSGLHLHGTFGCAAERASIGSSCAVSRLSQPTNPDTRGHTQALSAHHATSTPTTFRAAMLLRLHGIPLPP